MGRGGGASCSGRAPAQLRVLAFLSCLHLTKQRNLQEGKAASKGARGRKHLPEHILCGKTAPAEIALCASFPAAEGALSHQDPRSERVLQAPGDVMGP